MQLPGTDAVRQGGSAFHQRTDTPLVDPYGGEQAEDASEAGHRHGNKQVRPVRLSHRHRAKGRGWPPAVATRRQEGSAAVLLPGCCLGIL